MTKTIQPCSWEAVVYTADKESRSLLALSNNLNELYENMNKLNFMLKDYVSQTKKLEQIFHTIETKEQ